jgi:uncharacterized protein
MGLVLLLFRNTSDRSLLIWAGCLLVSHLVVTTAIVLSQGTLDPGAPLVRGGQWLFGVEGLSNDALFEVYANGSLVDFLKLQSTSLFYRPAFLLSSSRLQRVLAMFLVGCGSGAAAFSRTRRAIAVCSVAS